jgi:hypothetical protein
MLAMVRSVASHTVRPQAIDLGGPSGTCPRTSNMHAPPPCGRRFLSPGEPHPLPCLPHQSAITAAPASALHHSYTWQDRSVRKGITAGFAARHGLRAARLPIKEHAQSLGLAFPGATTRPVLNVSDVVVALLEARRTGDWEQALRAALPQRKQRASRTSIARSKGPLQDAEQQGMEPAHEACP